VWLTRGFSRRLKPMVGDPLVSGSHPRRGRHRDRDRFPLCIAPDPLLVSESHHAPFRYRFR